MSDDKRKPTDPVEAAFAQLGHKRKYSYGDLVSWAGELWFVDGWRLEAMRGHETEHFEDIEYSLSRVYADGTFNDWAEVFQGDEDVTLVCTAAYADEYIANSGITPKEGVQMVGMNYYHDASGGDDGKKQTKPPRKHREAEKSEVQRRADYRAKVDGLLDEYNRLLSEGDGEGAARIMGEIETRAQVHSEGGSGLIADIMSASDSE